MSFLIRSGSLRCLRHAGRVHLHADSLSPIAQVTLPPPTTPAGRAVRSALHLSATTLWTLAALHCPDSSKIVGNALGMSSLPRIPPAGDLPDEAIDVVFDSLDLLLRIPTERLTRSVLGLAACLVASPSTRGRFEERAPGHHYRSQRQNSSLHVEQQVTSPRLDALDSRALIPHCCCCCCFGLCLRRTFRVIVRTAVPTLCTAQAAVCSLPR